MKVPGDHHSLKTATLQQSEISKLLGHETTNQEISFHFSTCPQSQQDFHRRELGRNNYLCIQGPFRLKSETGFSKFGWFLLVPVKLVLRQAHSSASLTSNLRLLARDMKAPYIPLIT